MKSSLLPPEQRKARVADKRRQVLRFLRQEIYTARYVIEALLGLTESPARRTLATLERDGLVANHILYRDGLPFHLWGITPAGQFEAVIPGSGDEVVKRWFRPSEVGLLTLNHTLQLQLMGIRAQQAGWLDWKCDRQMGFIEPQIGRPDAMVTCTDDVVYAVELELSHKTRQRYERILFDRLRAIKTGHFDRCVWVARDTVSAARLREFILAITTIPHPQTGATLKIVPEVHHPRLAFIALDQWPHALTDLSSHGLAQTEEPHPHAHQDDLVSTSSAGD